MINHDDSSFLPANLLLDDAERDADRLLDNARLDLRLLDEARPGTPACGGRPCPGTSVSPALRR